MSIVRVAKLVGVSNSTVSRVINNQSGVSTETAEAVREAMGKLGYRPSSRRPGPKPGPRGQGAETRILCLGLGASPFRSAPAFEGVMEGMALAMRRQGLNLGYGHMPGGDVLPDGVIPEGTTGLLLHGTKASDAVADRLRRYPSVWVMGNRQRPAWGDQVMPNAARVGEIAAEYLLSRGHKSLAFFNLDLGYWVLRGYRDAFRAAAEDVGVTVHTLEQERRRIDGRLEDFTPQRVDALIEQFLQLPARPTGIFIAGDLQASVLQPALQRHGVVIEPGKTEVISVNNERPFLIGLRPTPAVIDIHTPMIGQYGVDQLLWRIKHPDAPERLTTLVEPSLVLPS